MSTVYDYVQTRLNWSTDTRSQKLLLSKIQEIILSDANRRLYRHESGMGTVMEYNDGESRSVLVLDAASRSTNKQLRTSTDSILTLSEYNSNNQSRNGYVGGESRYNSTVNCSTITDAILNELWWTDANSSLANTDTWVSESSSPAAEFCKSIRVSGCACELPTLQILLRIFCEAELLDSLDPTIKDNPELSLSAWLNGTAAWSSTKSSPQQSWAVYSYGYCGPVVDTESLGIIPVLEL